MTTEANEMDNNYASGYAAMPPDGQTIELPMTTDISSDDMSITLGTPVAPETDPSNIFVYADNITQAMSNVGPIAAFDVVFSVNCTCPDTGAIKLYKVVKRIGVDKCKMMQDAQTTTPVSIVEAKKQPKVEGFEYSADRFKALAGLK